MGNGLGGKKIEEMEAIIKAFSGATPGSEEYAIEFDKYIKDPDGYGKKQKIIIQKSPQQQTDNQFIKKAIGGKPGKFAQEYADTRKSISQDGILFHAFKKLFK